MAAAQPMPPADRGPGLLDLDDDVIARILFLACQPNTSLSPPAGFLGASGDGPTPISAQGQSVGSLAGVAGSCRRLRSCVRDAVLWERILRVRRAEENADQFGQTLSDSDDLGSGHSDYDEDDDDSDENERIEVHGSSSASSNLSEASQSDSPSAAGEGGAGQEGEANGGGGHDDVDADSDRGARQRRRHRIRRSRKRRWRRERRLLGEPHRHQPAAEMFDLLVDDDREDSGAATTHHPWKPFRRVGAVDNRFVFGLANAVLSARAWLGFPPPVVASPLPRADLLRMVTSTEALLAGVPLNPVPVPLLHDSVSRRLRRRHPEDSEGLHAARCRATRVVLHHVRRLKLAPDDVGKQAQESIDARLQYVPLWSSVQRIAGVRWASLSALAPLVGPLRVAGFTLGSLAVRIPWMRKPLERRGWLEWHEEPEDLDVVLRSVALSRAETVSRRSIGHFAAAVFAGVIGPMADDHCVGRRGSVQCDLPKNHLVPLLFAKLGHIRRAYGVRGETPLDGESTMEAALRRIAAGDDDNGDNSDNSDAAGQAHDEDFSSGSEFTDSDSSELSSDDENAFPDGVRADDVSTWRSALPWPSSAEMIGASRPPRRSLRYLQSRLHARLLEKCQAVARQAQFARGRPASRIELANFPVAVEDNAPHLNEICDRLIFVPIFDVTYSVNQRQYHAFVNAAPQSHQQVHLRLATRPFDTRKVRQIVVTVALVAVVFSGYVVVQFLIMRAAYRRVLRLMRAVLVLARGLRDLSPIARVDSIRQGVFTRHNVRAILVSLFPSVPIAGYLDRLRFW
jgi:hypothetical protein